MATITVKTDIFRRLNKHGRFRVLIIIFDNGFNNNNIKLMTILQTAVQIGTNELNEDEYNVSIVRFSMLHRFYSE